MNMVFVLQKIDQGIAPRSSARKKRNLLQGLLAKAETFKSSINFSPKGFHLVNRIPLSHNRTSCLLVSARIFAVKLATVEQLSRPESSGVPLA
jgi:hypothetical protein